MSDYMDRFWAKVESEPNTGCWLWTGASTESKGGARYGRIGFQRKSRAVHRFAYEQLVGPIPEGLSIDHLCRTPLCVNPAHMEPVTIKENILRGQGMGARHARATRCPEGHVYDDANTSVVSGRRVCIECRRRRGRINQRAYRERQAVLV